MNKFTIKPKKIKVLYLAVGGKYGSDQSLLCLLKTARKNIEPYVIMPRDRGMASLLKAANIPYSIFPIYPNMLPLDKSFKDILLLIPRHIRIILFNFLGLFYFFFIIWKFKPEIIHTNTGTFRTGFIAARILKIKHVWHLREYIDLDLHCKIVGGRNRFSRLLQNNWNNPIAITKGIAAYFGVNKENTIYNGIRSKSEVVNKLNKKNYFLFVGSLHEGKGVIDLLEAFAKITLVNEDKKVELYIVGKCYNSNYQKKIDDILLMYPFMRERLYFLGERNDVNLLMSEALAIVVPSYHEAFGRVVAEAMFNGCLVIGRDTDGVKEQFDNGFSFLGSEIGLRFNTQDQLIHLMTQLVRYGIEEYYPMIDNAQRTAVALYSNEAHADSIYHFYKSLL